MVNVPLHFLADVTEPIEPVQWVFAFAGVAIAAMVGLLCGVQRRGSIDGPDRLPAEASTFNLWLAILAAIIGQIFLPVFVALPFVGSLHEPLTAHQTAVFYLCSACCGLASLLAAYWLQKPRWKMSRPLRSGIVPGLLGMAALIPLVLAVTILTQQVWHWTGRESPESHQLLQAFNDTASRADRWIVIVSAAVVAPIFEEMLFRAHLQTAVRQLTGWPWLAVAVASGLFAIAHGSAWMLAPLLVLAIGLGYLYERTANLYAVIFVHAAFNGLMIALDALLLSHHG